MSRLGVTAEELDAFRRRWKISELSFFGSILREDFSAESDVDLLITFESSAKWTLLDYVRMEEDLAGVVGRPVDIVERQAVESSENYIRRRHILEQPKSPPGIDEALLLDILLAGRRALGFTRGVNRKAFSGDELLQNALLRCLGIIGLATRKLSGATKDAHPEIAWDRMMHVPPGSRLWSHTSEDKLWETVTRDLPELVAAIAPLVPPDEGEA